MIVDLNKGISALLDSGLDNTTIFVGRDKNDWAKMYENTKREIDRKIKNCNNHSNNRTDSNFNKGVNSCGRN